MRGAARARRDDTRWVAGRAGRYGRGGGTRGRIGGGWGNGGGGLRGGGGGVMVRSCRGIRLGRLGARRWRGGGRGGRRAGGRPRPRWWLPRGPGRSGPR